MRRLGRDIRGNPDQRMAVRSPLDRWLYVVAGPGSGKTTVIALRVLKLVFVDGIDPASAVVTTFTRKAASELRSRILGWGDQLRDSFLRMSKYAKKRGKLKGLDLNRIITGTLDSIAEEALNNYRDPASPPPIVIESFVSNALMIRVGLFSRGRYNDQNLRDFIAHLRGRAWNLSVSELSTVVRELKERICHDQVNVQQFRGAHRHPGVPVLCDAIDDYNNELESRLLFDFGRLEQEFLARLQSGSLEKFLQGIRFLLVDEYQDTNLLQEQIYFEMARAALANDGSVAVVGDDDQSLYRFRGATVDLFRNFPSRLNNQLGVRPRTVYLSGNYRSTPILVDFCEGFVTLDQSYQSARVPNKPPLVSLRSPPYEAFPIVGMFRDDSGALARDLGAFIHTVIHGRGVEVRDHDRKKHRIRIDPKIGGPSDVAILFGSPREHDASQRPRLPLLLRNELSGMQPAIQVFNPRGEQLETVDAVQVLCGLILECLDPGEVVQNSQNFPQVALHMFGEWRDAATSYAAGNPPPIAPTDLPQFITEWQNRRPLPRRRWDRETPLIQLAYKLVTWIPSLQNDIEGLVYLESIARTISQAGLFGSFGGQLVRDPGVPGLEEASIKEALWNVFMPLATGAIQINEELLETMPPDRVNVMSIHQSKGLEFPLVIVDIGSDFRTDHYAHAFKRFPRDGGKSCLMENELRQFSPLGLPQRPPLDRAFDDLTRLYFEAYSRAQDALLLVGLTTVRDRIPNIATGWDRLGLWPWGPGLSNLIHI